METGFIIGYNNVDYNSDLRIWYMHNGELSNCCADDCAGIYETPEGKYQEKDVVHSAPKFQLGDSVCTRKSLDAKEYKIGGITIVDSKYRYLIDDTYLHGFGHVYCDEEHLLPAPEYKKDEMVVVNLGDTQNNKLLKVVGIHDTDDGNWLYDIQADSLDYCGVSEWQLRPAPKYKNGQCIKHSFWPHEQTWIRSDPIWNNYDRQYYYHISGHLQSVSEDYVDKINSGIVDKYLFYDTKDKKFRILVDVDLSKIGNRIKRIGTEEEYNLFKALIELQKDKDVFELLKKKLYK